MARKKIFEQANDEGIWIIDNSKKIADATRQCVNARIQGSAADLTKLAMIKIHNHPVLTRLGFKLLLQVHDEVIGQCPEENVKECSRLLAEIMSQAAEEVLEMPIKCDVEITDKWYGTPYNVENMYDDDGNLLPKDMWLAEEHKEKETQTSHAMDAELRQ